MTYDEAKSLRVAKEWAWNYFITTSKQVDLEVVESDDNLLNLKAGAFKFTYKGKLVAGQINPSRGVEGAINLLLRAKRINKYYRDYKRLMLVHTGSRIALQCVKASLLVMGPAFMSYALAAKFSPLYILLGVGASIILSLGLAELFGAFVVEKVDDFFFLKQEEMKEFFWKD